MEALRIIEKYANDLREIIRKLRRRAPIDQRKHDRVGPPVAGAASASEGVDRVVDKRVQGLWTDRGL